jgi:hypothetical protein
MTIATSQAAAAIQGYELEEGFYEATQEFQAQQAAFGRAARAYQVCPNAINYRTLEAASLALQEAYNRKNDRREVLESWRANLESGLID